MHNTKFKRGDRVIKTYGNNEHGAVRAARTEAGVLRYAVRWDGGYRSWAQERVLSFENALLHITHEINAPIVKQISRRFPKP